MELSLKTEKFNLAFEQEVFDPHVAIKLIEVVSGAEPQRVTQKTYEITDITSDDKEEALPILKNLPPKLKDRAVETTVPVAPFVPGEESFEPEEPEVNRRKWFEQGETVKVNFFCPACSFVGVARTRWGNSYTKCPVCHSKAFNQPATEDGFGYVDNRGCAYKAEDMFLYPSERKEFENIFDGSKEEESW